MDTLTKRALAVNSMDQTLIIAFRLVVLIFSVMIHEISHGLMALRLGDATARDAGRLSFNPLRHLDLYGSVLLPLFLLAVGSPILFGWAKPVPFDPRRLRNPRRDSALVGAAGPLSNLAVAAVFGIITRIVAAAGDGTSAFASELLPTIVIINLLLAVFNLIPIQPLDGSRLFFGLLGSRAAPWEAFLSRYGMWLLILLLFLGVLDFVITPIIAFLYGFLVG